MTYIYANCFDLELNLVSSSLLLIIEFETIIVILHNNQASNLSQNSISICSFPLHIPNLITITSFLNNLVLLFYRYDASNKSK